MPKDTVLFDVKDKIAFITLNNPDNQNRLDPEMCKALGEAWDHFAKDNESRVALLSANGKNFCMGADLRNKGLTIRDLGRAFPPNGTKILKPIVGAVQGMIAGSGYGLATYGTDITYATKDTQFVFAESWVGIVGSVMEYAPYMPFKIAMEFYLSGQPMSADRAYEIGFVNYVAKDMDELMTEATKMAAILRDNAPLTLRAIKYGQYKNRENAQTKANRIAQEEFNAYIQPQLDSEDYKEGVKALIENRKPAFKGR